MNAPKFWMVLPALLVAGAVTLVHAKLPAPPPVDPAKAAEAKAKAADAAKKENEELARAQDRAVDHYKKEKGIKTVAAPAKKKK